MVQHFTKVDDHCRPAARVAGESTRICSQREVNRDGESKNNQNRLIQSAPLLTRNAPVGRAFVSCIWRAVPDGHHPHPLQKFNAKQTITFHLIIKGHCSIALLQAAHSSTFSLSLH